MEKTEKLNQFSRKQFLRTAGSTALFAALGIGLYGCGDNSTSPYDNGDEGSTSGITISDNGDKIEIDLTASDVENLKTSGGWLLINDANTLVVNVDGTNIRAFTSVCTHAGCSDSWAFSNGLFECSASVNSSCVGHGSRFNTGGAVVMGPATSDLAEFDVTIEGDLVTINK
jgi:Rieske Fe-S protein